MTLSRVRWLHGGHSVYSPYRGLQVTLPFDTTDPERRPNRVVFWTDDDTETWLKEQASSLGWDLSLVCHRIAKAAKQGSGSATPKRRASDAA